MDAILQRYMIISAGEGNRFGQPNEEMLQRISEVGAAVMLTYELSTIEVIMDGEQM